MLYGNTNVKFTWGQPYVTAEGCNAGCFRIIPKGYHATAEYWWTKRPNSKAHEQQHVENGRQAWNEAFGYIAALGDACLCAEELQCWREEAIPAKIWLAYRRLELANLELELRDYTRDTADAQGLSQQRDQAKKALAEAQAKLDGIERRCRKLHK